jgi:myosin heavy subunit
MSLKNLENEYENKKKELEDQLKKSRDQNKKLQLAMKKMEEEYEERLRELEGQIKKLKDENKKLKQRIKEIEDEYENKIRELENKYKRMEKEYKNKILELEEELKRKEELIKKLKNKNNKLIEENENLKDELERLRGELREKEKIIESFQSVRKDIIETPNKNGKKVRKTSITKVITKTKRIRNLGEAHYISTTPTKNYKLMLTSDNKPIIRTSYESITKTHNGIGNSKFLTEKNRKSLQNYDNTENEENSYIIKSRFSQNKTNLNPIFNTFDRQFLSEEEVVKMSDIIERENEIDLIKEKLGKSNLSLALLYKASRDGDDAEIFHSRVDNIKNNITFIKTNKGVRFGGYTNQSWDGINVFKEDDSAFIFSLTKLKTYDVNKKESAIWCNPNYGPIFGGYQIDIFDKFMSKNMSKTGMKGIGYDTNEDFELNNGEKNFLVYELEVYEIQDL